MRLRQALLLPHHLHRVELDHNTGNEGASSRMFAQICSWVSTTDDFNLLNKLKQAYAQTRHLHAVIDSSRSAVRYLDLRRTLEQSHSRNDVFYAIGLMHVRNADITLI